MGSPDFAVPTLEALVEAGHEVVTAYTQPPRPAGRGKAERPTAVDERAGDGEAPLHASKVMLVDPTTGKPSRVKVSVVDGKKQRTAKSGAVIAAG